MSVTGDMLLFWSVIGGVSLVFSMDFGRTDRGLRPRITLSLLETYFPGAIRCFCELGTTFLRFGGGGLEEVDLKRASRNTSWQRLYRVDCI